MKIIFIGTPEFGANILEKLCETEYKPVLVITAPDKPVGRKQILTPSPVKLVAEKYGVPVLQPENIDNLKTEIEKRETDLVIVVAFGQIISRQILDIPRYGCLNIHPSLLPRWRGASPIQSSILNSDTETGVTIILMDEKMDRGKIVSNVHYPISNNKITFELLSKELSDLAAGLLVDTIPKWVKGEINPLPQDESKATYTKILKKDDGKIDWVKTAVCIERQIRAFNPWPGVFAIDEDLKTIKILKADVLEQTGRGSSGSPGKTFLASNDKIAVQCGKDYLIIEELQPEGKKRMTAKEFLMGHQNFVGIILR